MKSAIALCGLLLVGCATSGARDSIKPSPVQMIGDFEATESARFAHLADADGDGTAEADLRVCVAPSGRVSSAEVVRSSGSKDFDGAATRDVSRAAYRTFAAPADVTLCSNVRLVVSEG